MSILIKGMEMPKGPEIIIVFPDKTVQKYLLGMRENLEWAHAVELPPHGDLIDRDELWKDAKSKDLKLSGKDFAYDRGFVNGYRLAVHDALRMPAIIPGEENVC